MSDLPDVQQYLKSVCNHYAQWWKDYAFMDEINASTWFEFELTSRTEDKPKSSEEKPPDKLPPQPVLQAIENYANEKILIVGSSGAGKSTLLARIFWQAAERARHDETAPIPVLVELKAYQLVGDRSGIRGLILNSLESHDPSLDSDDLKKLLKQKRLMLLVDGLNELQQAQAKNDLKKFCLNISLIATARHAGDGWEIERKLELQPLSQLQVRDFLEVRLPTSDRDRLQELSDRVQDFGQTPLMVWMLYCIFRTGDEIPETRGEVYRKFTNLYVERSKEGIDLDESRSLLSRLAFGMMQSPEPGDPTDFQLDISEVDAQNLLGSEKGLKLLRNYHLLQSPGESGNRRVRFCHQSLQEYYAAEALLTQLPKLLEDQQGNNDLKSDYLNYIKWTEPVALMLALVESEAQAVRVVELALEADLMLGARLAGEVPPRFQERTVGMVNLLETTLELKCKLLSRTASEKAIPHLSKFQREEKSLSTSLSVLLALSPMKTNSSIREINGIISQHDELKDIQNNSSKIFQNITESLSNVWKNINFNKLSESIERIKEEKEYLRHYITENLKTSSLEKIVTVLLQKPCEESFHTLYCLPNLLRELLGKQAIPGLLIMAASQDTIIRELAIQELGKISNNVVISALIKMIKDRNEPVNIRRAIILALGKTGSKIPTLDLIAALKDPDLSIRRAAISSIGSIGIEIAIPELLKSVEDESLDIRKSATEALIKIKDGASLSHLWHLRCQGRADLSDTIAAIQENCRYYNYEIFQAYLEAQKPDRPKSQNSDRSPTTTNHFPNATEVKIFENVDRYHEAPPPPKDPPS